MYVTVCMSIIVYIIAMSVLYTGMSSACNLIFLIIIYNHLEGIFLATGTIFTHYVHQIHHHHHQSFLKRNMILGKILCNIKRHKYTRFLHITTINR